MLKKPVAVTSNSGIPVTVSCGSCWDTCPGFFEHPDDSSSQVVEKVLARALEGEK